MFLDDIQLLQDNPISQVSLLLGALTGGVNVFLLNEATGELIDSDLTNGTSTFKINKNYIAWDGIIYEIPETTLTVPSWDTPVYVGLQTTDTGVRTFEDGQDHACLQTKQAYLSLEKTGTEMLNIWELKTLFELMGPLVKANEPVSVYKNVDVTFYNGYTGTVQYKEESDYYKVVIKLSSLNSEWDLSGGALFGITPSKYSFMAEKVSNSFLTGGDTPGRQKIAQIKIVDNGAFLSGIDLTDSLNAPIFCRINAIMIIPK